MQQALKIKPSLPPTSICFLLSEIEPQANRCDVIWRAQFATFKASHVHRLMIELALSRAAIGLLRNWAVESYHIHTRSSFSQCSTKRSQAKWKG
jgi:hypothetical protein